MLLLSSNRTTGGKTPRAGNIFRATKRHRTAESKARTHTINKKTQRVTQQVARSRVHSCQAACIGCSRFTALTHRFSEPWNQKDRCFSIKSDDDCQDLCVFRNLWWEIAVFVDNKPRFVLRRGHVLGEVLCG